MVNLCVEMLQNFGLQPSEFYALTEKDIVEMLNITNNTVSQQSSGQQQNSRSSARSVGRKRVVK